LCILPIICSTKHTVCHFLGTQKSQLEQDNWRIRNKYCDGLGDTSDVIVATQQLLKFLTVKFPKQPNCWETGAMQDATMIEAVFNSRCKHCILRGNK
jgi:hypothetical protein